jgi:endonuclease-3
MRKQDLPKAIKILREEYARFKIPAVTVFAESTRDPFHVLVSCILSLRTQDKTTFEASERLFKIAPDAALLAGLTVKQIEQAIYPVGFYRNKARDLKVMAKSIATDYCGKVPDTIDELLKFKGVGRKTANLVVTLGFNKPGICVDIHVHRITNRWGYVKTASPDKTETALRKKLPPEFWIEINDLLVAYGQNLCKPISPFCSNCRLYEMCKRVGVEKRR